MWFVEVSWRGEAGLRVSDSFVLCMWREWQKGGQRGWEWLLLRFMGHLYDLNLLSPYAFPPSVKKIGADPQVQPCVYKRLFNLC